MSCAQFELWVVSDDPAQQAAAEDHAQGCPRCNSFAEGGTRLDECLCSHGEENAITQASYHGVSVRGGVLYTTFCPCLMCTKMIINAGIEEVAYNAAYPLGDLSLKLLREAGVKVRQVALDT